ncbi:Gfo/Idh/MocA family oxidoreductase [Natronosporangium hydrolyticum]|uniref:Gfo/Idh/MocA family oxidoreductase n=1 Tax=Natronosporangium hydrolyticum TaxID=2811111 RepID=A0A895YGZ5_9ACTN|nr:Gfo/Idh/MocA family oxidoreductase [Natronosporangium hydrolyticum]QSB15362.1 Gfo/Idh/MocA family oxidoreductase [Natronosporangium hydrolyticum]
MSQTARIGVIGLGWIGGVHAEFLTKLEGMELAGVADAAAEAAAELGGRFGVPHFDSAAALLEAVELDAVIVAVPPAYHHEIVLAAIRRGVGVLCEKPLAHDLPTMAEMVQAAEQAQVPTMIGFPARFAVSAEEFCLLRDAGELGEIEHIRTNFRFSTAKHDESHGPWQWNKAAGGGALLEASPHMWDLVRHLTGQEIVEVYGLARHFDGDRSGAERVFTAIAKLSGGALATVDMACTLPWGATTDKRTEVFGTAGMVYLDEFTNFLTVNTEAGCEIAPGSRISGTGHPDALWHSRVSGGLRRELEYFARCVRQGLTPQPTFRDGLEASLAAHAVDRAIRQERPVRVDELRSV